MDRVLVLGVPRGGTTWVAEAMAHCRGAVYVHEPDGVHEPFAFHARRADHLEHYSILHAGDRAPEYERLWDGVFAGGRRPGSIRDVVSRRAYRRVTSEQKNRARAGGRAPLSLMIADRFAVPRQADPAHGTVVAKSVNAALAAEWLFDRWHPRVLVVRRDVRNVLASWLAIGFGGPRQPVLAGMVDEARQRWGVTLPVSDDAHERAAVACTVMMLALYEGVRDHDEWRVVDHEAACLDPVARLRDAAISIGLEWTSAAEEFVVESDRPGTGYSTQRVAGDLPDRWKSRLDDEHVALIERTLERVPAALWETPAPRCS